MRKLDKNEIQGKLEGFPLGFKERFGKDLDKAKLKQFLMDELDRIEQSMIKEAWANLHPETIRIALSEISLEENNEALHIVPNNKGAKHYKVPKSKKTKEIKIF